jgi:formylglycine-generating enzyme required for sulfatase activity
MLGAGESGWVDCLPSSVVFGHISQTTKGTPMLSRKETHCYWSVVVLVSAFLIGCPAETSPPDGDAGGDNAPPVADAQSVTVEFETATAIVLTGSDPDDGPLPLSYAIVTPPEHGVLTGSAPDLVYTPDAGFTGADSFSFTASDGAADSDPATVSITVQSNDTLTLNLGGGVTLVLVRIPAGTFQMGDLSGAGYATERPAHSVTISRPFYLGRFEVTQAQWVRVMGATSFYRTGDNQPAEFISWSDAQDFCQQVSALTGRTARLPTEAEWEYACRAGTSTDYFFGNDSAGLSAYAWYGGDSGSQTHDVGGKLPNPWGLYDMLGNVWEMCQDWYGAYDAAAVVDPTGPATGTTHPARGGAYGSTAAGGELRCSARNQVDSTHAYGADAGFRLVVEAP